MVGEGLNEMYLEQFLKRGREERKCNWVEKERKEGTQELCPRRAPWLEIQMPTTRTVKVT